MEGNVVQIRDYQQGATDNASMKSRQKKEALRRMERELILHHRSESTRDSYLYYLSDFIDYRYRTNTATLGADLVREYLTYMAVEGKVSASTQNVALCALLFFYGKVLKQDIGLIDAPRAKKPKHLPTVLSKDEVILILSKLSGVLLEDGENIRVVQDLLGHESIETTMVYLHVMQLSSGVKSPYDRLMAAGE